MNLIRHCEEERSVRQTQDRLRNPVPILEGLLHHIQFYMNVVHQFRLVRNDREKGFTLIELLVVVSIVSLLGVLSTGFYSRFYTQNSVSNTVDDLTGELRKAQIYSMMGRQTGVWGVHNGTTQIVLFLGNSYAARTAAFDELFSVNNNVSMSGFSDITFSRMTGTPSAVTTISITGNTNSKTITINAQGAISR